jgi:Ca2+-binding EF-hand superfamily protein
MKRYALLLSACAAALTLSGASYAQPPGGRGAGGFGLLQFDTNADGKLTKAEFDAAQRARFNQIDANKDGSATPEEIRTGMETQMKANREAAQKGRFAELDKDKSGQISQSEFLAGIEARRGAPDLPRPDGAGRPGFGPRLVFGLPGGPFGDRGPGERRGPRPDGAQGPGGPPPQGGDQRAMRAGPGDADGDGKITFAEFAARSSEAFARADANKDGTVTIAELQAMPAGPR